ncbi:RICIN domain-containing protein [Streptomyces fulvoviolaceus]|uniref:RICIN domain-containing protein n=1 Tax=Streptomyces fulvoviolaceus TaxID=285535 RepID=UPI0006945BF0|nr:RICIN domain-containing protein [Streptomyces fulvoviolaceus]MCT9082854.1 RICIN domain-containing protein [Streptomyces fulvoviolaceus]
MRKRSMAAIVGAVAAIAIPLSATSANAVGVEGTTGIRNDNSQKCLAIPGGSSAANGTAAIQFTCDKAADGSWDTDQLWTWTLVSGATSTYTLKNYATGKCLAIGGGSHTLGAEAIQWPCNGSTEQQWIYDSSHRLWNKESDLCLAIPSANVANGVAAVQWTCRDVSTNPEQKWDQVA